MLYIPHAGCPPLLLTPHCLLSMLPLCCSPYPLPPLLLTPRYLISYAVYSPYTLPANADYLPTLVASLRCLPSHAVYLPSLSNPLRCLPLYAVDPLRCPTLPPVYFPKLITLLYYRSSNAVCSLKLSTPPTLSTPSRSPPPDATYLPVLNIPLSCLLTHDGYRPTLSTPSASYPRMLDSALRGQPFCRRLSRDSYLPMLADPLCCLSPYAAFPPTPSNPLRCL